MIHVFDFDGVLADACEDAIYRLPVTENEKVFLQQASNIYGFSQDHDPAYTRHIAIQYRLLDLKIDIQPGPYFGLATSINEPFYILTARSAPPAIIRVQDFLKCNELFPQEIFFVGRAGKTAQLKWICEHHDYVTFYDDSINHIKDAESLELANLQTVHVKPEIDHFAVKNLYERLQKDF